MTDYEKLKDIIEEIDELIEKKTTSNESIFQAWKIKAERFLIKSFGENSLEHNMFSRTHFYVISFGQNVSRSESLEACKKGLEKTKAIFMTYLEDLADDAVTEPTETKLQDYSKVFIVHGHDGELKQSVARIIEKQGIDAIILSEQANKGRTIIEKFEDYSDVGGAICLFTSDDVGHDKNNNTDNARARQNVVLEAGYFMGKLGREHTVILADNEVEMPSDLSGVVYTDTAKWETDLLKELKEMGYTIDFNKMF